jgi:hypothetical protein
MDHVATAVPYTMTEEERNLVQSNIERSGELWSYLMEYPDEAEQLNGATVVFDEESFKREKKNGGKIVFAQKTYLFSHDHK